MEMGQRSLGNRSIVADPRFHDNIGKINRSIKQRDFWMPFAPIILFEYQDIIIKNPKKINSPFMTITYETIKGKEIFPAATHQADGTARAQLLKKDQKRDIEMAAEDLRMATRHLGGIVGKVDVEEILGSIFKDFCSFY